MEYIKAIVKVHLFLALACLACALVAGYVTWSSPRLWSPPIDLIRTLSVLGTFTACFGVYCRRLERKK